MILSLPLNSKKVLVIDDEINGITLEVALNEGQDLFNELRDINSPTTEEILNIINNDFSEYSNFIENQNFSLELIQNIFLNETFQKKLQDETKELFFSLNQKNAILKNIRNVIEQSFPKPLYEIDFLLNYDAAGGLEIEKFDLLILDWYLSPNTTNEEYLKNTLSGINNLPPIILITSHPDINNSETRSIFFENTRISASGLTTLTKDKILSPDFGSIGLSKISSQLINQRKISNSIRRYIKDWENALDNAKKKTLNTLWQLDTFIIKSIQEDATIDGQPYHDHFHNFIERENSWHIEKEFDSKSNIEALGELLENHTYNDILTHYTDKNSFNLHRKVLTHYSFKGYERRLKIASKKSTKLRENILYDIPFGAILKPKDIHEKTDIAYINITQACDLSNLCRSPDNSSSIVLMKMKLTKRELKESFIFDTSNYIITSFPINNEFYDLKPLPMSLISNNFDDFYRFAVNHNLYVVGEVRYDIATGLQQKAISHLIRPSQPRIHRPSISEAKLVFCKNLNTGKTNEFGRIEYDKKTLIFPHSIFFVGTQEIKGMNKVDNLIQLIGQDHHRLIQWIFDESNIIKEHQEYLRSSLLNFFFSPIKLTGEEIDMEKDNLIPKLKVIKAQETLEKQIKKCKVGEDQTSFFIVHQVHHHSLMTN
jgi:hypothetical protein